MSLCIGRNFNFNILGTAGFVSAVTGDSYLSFFRAGCGLNFGNDRIVMNRGNFNIIGVGNAANGALAGYGDDIVIL